MLTDSKSYDLELQLTLVLNEISGVSAWTVEKVVLLPTGVRQVNSGFCPWMSTFHPFLLDIM